MKYFNEEEIMSLVKAIDKQDSWDTPEMEEFVQAAVKESDDELDPSAYGDPDSLYFDCLKVFGLKWYAVQETREDAWDIGSHDYDEAVRMLREQGHGLIAVINEAEAFCEDEIEYEDIAD